MTMTKASWHLQKKWEPPRWGGQVFLFPLKIDSCFLVPQKWIKVVPEIHLYWVPVFPEIELHVSPWSPKIFLTVPTISLMFHFHFRPLERGWPATIFRKYLTEVKSENLPAGKQSCNRETNAHVKNFCLLLHNTTRLYLHCNFQGVIITPLVGLI